MVKWILGISLMAVAMGFAATATIPAATVPVDAVSLKFLPPETQSLAFIDVGALRTAPLLKDALNGKNINLPAQFDEFLRATGLDVQRDLDRVTIAKMNARQGFAVAQGRIDKFKAEQYFKDKGKQPEAYLGQSLYRDGNGAFVFFDDVVLAGEVAAVKKAIDQMQLPGSLPLRPELMAALQTIEPGNHVWGAGTVSMKDFERLGVPGPRQVADIVKTLRTGTYQMRVDTGIHAKAVGNFADAESAKNVSDLARGALAIGKLQLAKQKPELLQIVDGIQVSSSGATVTVLIEESEQAIKALNKK